MKKTYKIIAIFIATISLFGCSDNYFDVDTPSNSVDISKLGLKDLLAPTIYYTARAQVSTAQVSGMYSQQIASAFSSTPNADMHSPESIPSSWNDVYLNILPSLKQIEIKANEQNAVHYKGIAHVLKAINLGLMTDYWGNIPYSEASQSPMNFTPVFDTQESIYTEIDNLLSTAIAELGATDTTLFQPGTDDLIYQGNMSKWIKVAYSYKARFALHLMKKNGSAATATAVLAALASGINSNTLDFQLVYNDRNLNPWYTSQLGLNTGNLSYFVSKHFISNMNGVYFPFTSPTTMDPRLPILVDIRNYPNPTASATNPDPNIVANYKGCINGTGGKFTITPSANANARIGIEYFYSKATSPVVMMSYAEVQFMKAEAEFLLAGGTPTSVGTSAAANTAYIAGINANMDKLGVTAAQKSAYLAEPSVNLGVAGLSLKNIMREKFITLFLTTESFNDQRRYDFSTNVFPGLTLPAGRSASLGTNWVRRFQYSTTEANTNPVNYAANFKDNLTRVWWDN